MSKGLKTEREGSLPEEVEAKRRASAKFLRWESATCIRRTMWWEQKEGGEELPSCRSFEAMVGTLACTLCEMEATRGL